MAKNSFNINIILKGFQQANKNLNKTTENVRKVKKGTSEAKAQADKYRLANQKLQLQIKKLNIRLKEQQKNQDRLRISSSGLRREFGAFRNNLLLITFAFGGVIGSLRSFISASANFESIQARLVGLTGGVKQAEEAFAVFNKVAASTPFQLQDVVNAGAQLEAFGVNSKVVLRSVTDLAGFMGTSATDAANALGRAFAGGAGAADIFREKGVLNIIKEFKGIENITDLTLPEFRQAMIESLIEPSVGIAGSAERMSQTFTGAVSNMRDAMVQLSASVGNLFLDDLTEMTKGITTFVKSLNAKRVAEFGTAIAMLGGAFAILRIQATLAAATMGSFAKIGSLIAKVAAVLGIDALFRLTGTFDHLKQSTDDASNSIVKAQMTMEEYAKQVGELSTQNEKASSSTDDFAKKQENLTESLIKKLASLEAEKAALDGANLVRQTELSIMGRLTPQQEKLTIEIEKYTNAINNQKEELKKANEIEKEAERIKNSRLKQEQGLRQNLISIQNESKIIQAELDGASEKEIEAMRIKDQLLQKIISDTGESVAMYEGLNEVLGINSELEDFANLELTNGIEITQEYKDALVELYRNKLRLAESNIDLKDKQTETNDKLKDAQKDSQKAAQALSIFAGAVEGLGPPSNDSNKQLKALLRTMGQLATLAGMPVVGGFLQLGAAFAHTGGLIKPDGNIQRFANGGMIQGQDNVPIMAQAGEFVMRREAVQNIGVQNLAEMNRSGESSPTVNVNISGNMIGNESFVRDTLIPEISRAQRQNLA